MRIGDNHLTYCMNVHPAKSLADVLDNIQRYAVPIRQQMVAADQPFGLGLWLPVDAAQALRANPALLAEPLAAHNMYAFTINGFPYGVFHGERVKTAVYYPDWADQRRLNYTVDLLHILAALLPENVSGSISTSPVTYGKTLPDEAIPNLLAVAHAAREVEAETGRHITIALEPEPDCYLETSAEAIDFLGRLYEMDDVAREHLSVCFDTCHISLQQEDLATAMKQFQAAGIAIGKMQVSAALICDNRDGCGAVANLSPFDEPTYLHQTRVIASDGNESHRYPDLGPALEENAAGDWYVHFHVPLHFTGGERLSATVRGMDASFFTQACQQTPHLEIETYTFDVLPPPKSDIVDSIVAEYRWLQSRLG